MGGGNIAHDLTSNSLPGRNVYPATAAGLQSIFTIGGTFENLNGILQPSNATPVTPNTNPLALTTVETIQITWCGDLAPILAAADITTWQWQNDAIGWNAPATMPNPYFVVSGPVRESDDSQGAIVDNPAYAWVEDPDNPGDYIWIPNLAHVPVPPLIPNPDFVEGVAQFLPNPEWHIANYANTPTLNIPQFIPNPEYPEYIDNPLFVENWEMTGAWVDTTGNVATRVEMIRNPDRDAVAHRQWVEDNPGVDPINSPYVDALVPHIVSGDNVYVDALGATILPTFAEQGDVFMVTRDETTGDPIPLPSLEGWIGTFVIELDYSLAGS
jgi:hypothetical protein